MWVSVVSVVLVVWAERTLAACVGVSVKVVLEGKICWWV